jgi:hypothetical protein
MQTFTNQIMTNGNAFHHAAGFLDLLPPFVTLLHKGRLEEVCRKTMPKAHWTEMAGDIAPTGEVGACAGLPADALTDTLMATYDIIIGFSCFGLGWQAHHGRKGAILTVNG